MPLDAICLSAVVRETAAQVENTRIEKIQQPARDQVVLLEPAEMRQEITNACRHILRAYETMEHGTDT